MPRSMGPPEVLRPVGSGAQEQTGEEVGVSRSSQVHNGDERGEGARGSSEQDEVRARARREEKSQVAEDVRGETSSAEVEEESREQVSGARIRKVPRAPSEEEWRLHRATHCPFRSWCPKCVAGQAVRGSHLESEGFIGDDVPMVCVDYCFLRRGTDSDSSIPVLVAKVRKMNLMFAHVVPFKGGGCREVVSLLIKDLYRCGFHNKLILKGDQEPAIEDLLREVARARGQAETVIDFTGAGLL